MIKFTQSKLVVRNSDNEIIQHGNCYATAIACIMEIDPINVPSVENLFDIESNLWQEVMEAWISSKGWDLCHDNRYQVFHDEKYLFGTGERHDLLLKLQDTFYLASGKSSRGVQHIVIYRNGNMVWDTHPTREGIISIDYFQSLERK